MSVYSHNISYPIVTYSTIILSRASLDLLLLGSQTQVLPSGRYISCMMCINLFPKPLRKALVSLCDVVLCWSGRMLKSNAEYFLIVSLKLK